MVKAEFQTKSGMKIVLEGTSEELSEVIEEFEKRERRDEERKTLFERMMKEREKKFKEHRNHGANGTPMPSVKLTDILLGFVRGGFFDSPRKIGEVMAKFEKESIFPPTSTIHPLLGRLVMKEKLERKRNETGAWTYSKKEENKNVGNTHL